MWLLSMAGLLVAGGVPVDAGSGPAASEATESITTRQTVFSIPFQIDRAQHAGQAAVEVQLHVSVDGGATWQLYGRTDPAKAHFVFRAGGDGEYRFLVRTLDASGQLRPEANGQPGLRVLVDTAAPELRLDAARGKAGEIIAAWSVTELSPDPESLKVQYRTAPNQPWQFVAVDWEDVVQPGPTRTGEVTWWPASEARRIEVRAEVADLAGNQAVTHAQVDFDRDPAAGRGGNPGAVGQVDRGLSQRPRDGNPGAVGQVDRGFSQRPRDGNPGAVGQVERGFSQPAPLAALGWRPSVDAAPAVAEQAEPAASDDAGFAARGPDGSVAIQIHPEVRNRFIRTSGKPGRSENDALVPGVEPRMVNTGIFELDYQVESIGPSGLGSVELWGTRDGGKTWSSFGTDADKQSPMPVTVHEDGVYGFRVAVSSGVGLGGEKPQSGDVPDIWIGVDQTKPQTRIISAEQGTGSQAGRLIVRWEAADRMLGERPAALFFSEAIGGPWQPVASELAPSGHYAWPIDSRVPERIFLRLEVCDSAGNLGISETPEPVFLDQLRPVVRIRDVRPLGHTARTPARGYRLLEQ